MKPPPHTLLFLAIAALAMSPTPSPAQQAPPKDKPVKEDPSLDATSRFIFFAVLEGLFEDGVANKDVDAILLKKEGQAYYHFIYACPVCNATIWALEAYKARPKDFYGLKAAGGNFGKGLPETTKAALHSDDAAQRLATINDLVQTWMDRRIKAMHLPDAEREQLVEALEGKRKQGMEALENFRKLANGPNFGLDKAAPAYAETGTPECAVCNAAVGKPMKLPDNKPD